MASKTPPDPPADDELDPQAGKVHEEDHRAASSRPAFTVAPELGGAVHHDPVAAAAGTWRADEIDQAELDRQAIEREKARARVRGVGDDVINHLEENTIWVVSNRVDDRIVEGSFERDARHPNGECPGIGGSGPVRVYRTANIERLILAGSIIETPAPMEFIEIDDPDNEGQRIKVRNRKFPIQDGIDVYSIPASQPGRPTAIGRRLDPDLWSLEDRKAVVSRQRTMPREIAVAPGGIVPKREEVERPI